MNKLLTALLVGAFAVSLPAVAQNAAPAAAPAAAPMAAPMSDADKAKADKAAKKAEKKKQKAERKAKHDAEMKKNPPNTSEKESAVHTDGVTSTGKMNPPGAQATRNAGGSPQATPNVKTDPNAMKDRPGAKASQQAGSAKEGTAVVPPTDAELAKKGAAPATK